ncbi:MAG: hypothetical protein LBG15_00260 [Dysgonamonadaceae bacterium]|jgi:hypothetical protein|nr:hypothetical protein [Dysgonamonadaceae bacterium]
MKDINLRINEICIRFFGGNNLKFASAMSTSEANIRNYRSKTEPKFDFVNNLATKLEINYEWLFTGKGDMLNNKQRDHNTNQLITGNNNVQAGNNSSVDARHFYRDSPDVLRAQIEEKERLLQEKEARIKEKDAQIKEKDAQISKLLSIMSNK